MSYQDSFNETTVDGDNLVISGIADGVVSVEDGTLQGTTLDDTLIYTPGNLVVNPDLELNTLGLLTSLAFNSSGYVGIDGQLRFLEISTVGNYSHTFNTSGITLTNGPNQYNTTQNTLYLGTSQGNNWSLQNPSATTTITEIGSGTQTINRILMDSSTTGVSSWEISDTRSATHRGVIAYDHATDIWYFKSVNSTEVFRLEPTGIYFAQNLRPNGSVSIGTSLSRFQDAHFAGTVSATSYNGTLLTASQPNITSVGTLSSLSVSGNISGTLTTASQPNITTIGTLATGLDIASGYTLRINGSPVMYETGLGVGVLSSSLTSLGTLAIGLNIATGQTYRINGTAVLSATTLGSGVTASSLTSLGNLTALNLAGLTAPTTTGTRDLGTTTLRFRDLFSERVFLYTNGVSTGTTLANRLNINGPAWASSLNYGISIGCPYNSGSFHTAVESIIAQRSTTGGSFSISIGNIDRNTSGVTTTDYSRNGVFAYNRFGVNMPVNSNPSYCIEAYSPDANLMRIYNASSQNCFELNQSGTNTLCYVNSTLAGGNNAYFGLCPNTPNTAGFRIQAFNSSTTTSSLGRFALQNASGTLTDTIDITYNSFGPSTTNVVSLGGASNLFTGAYANSFSNVSPGTSACLQLDSTTKGVLIPRMTATQRDAITVPVTGMQVFNETSNRPSAYGNTVWRNFEYEPVFTYLTASTAYTSTTTGENLGGISITITAGQSGSVELEILGGTIYQSVATNTFYIGFSTTSGAQAYSSWNWGAQKLNTTSGTFVPIAFKWVKTGLTPSTAYTIYLKFGRVASSTVNVYSGGGTGEEGITAIYARPR